MRDARPAIELRGVVQRFGRERVLDGVDLVVPTGAITALLGPSGAGKTVTIKHILGLIRPTSGLVEVEGRNLSMLSDEELNELRRGMSAVLQGTLPFSCGLFFSLDVYENVAFPLRERTRWSEERIHEATMENLALVGANDPSCWVAWTLPWTPGRSGRHDLVIRATDTTGRRQPERAPDNDDGYLFSAAVHYRVDVACQAAG